MTRCSVQTRRERYVCLGSVAVDNFESEEGDSRTADRDNGEDANGMSEELTTQIADKAPKRRL
jgi:hypothetical protein